ncbi:MAG: hypothetical protein NWS51_03350 [Flavobacteriales bacterium]|nr:hypothetical protein [Flavobacteriales bacterium]
MKNIILFPILFLFLILSSTLHAQEIPTALGYASKIAGEEIKYFSPLHEFANTALLTRANGKSPISLQLEMEESESELRTFELLIGHSTGTSSGEREFIFSIDGKELFHFATSPKEPLGTVKAGKSDNDIAFEFRTLEQDINKDAFGFLRIEIPDRLLNKGELTVVGVNAESRDWLMVFEYKRTLKIITTPTQLVLRKNNKLQMNIAVDYPHLHFKPPSMKVVSKYFENTFPVITGYNSISLESYPASFSGIDTLRYFMGYKLVHTELVAIQPRKNFDFHIIHHSHNDIGYSHLQTEVEKIQTENIYKAIRWSIVPEKGDCQPIWHIESLWAVDNFMKQATKEEIALFIQKVKEGRIVLSANYANVLNGLCQPEELNWIVAYAKRLEKEFGIRIQNAMITDIPGITYDALNMYVQNNIPYLSLGPNYVETHADHGDRVGKVIRECGDDMFYWTPKNEPNKKLFVWTAGKGYSYFHNIQENEKQTKWENKISAYVNELVGKKYPYELVQLRYTKNADNGPVDTSLCTFVNNWNARYSSPKLTLSSVDKLFSEFEKRYGESLRTVTGEISPYWEDGAYSTAEEEMGNRNLARLTVDLEKHITQLPPSKENQEELFQLQKNIILFHEHTWGSWCSISDPEIFFTTEQWRIKKSFLDSALNQYLNLSAKVKFAYVEKDPVRKPKAIYDYTVNKKTGAIDRIYFDNDSLVFAENNHLFEFIYSKGISPQEFMYPKQVNIKTLADTHDKKYVHVTFELQGLKSVSVHYSLWKEDGIIRMTCSIDKALEKDKESLHISVGTGKNGTLTYGKDGSELDFQTSRLPGSNADFICTTNAFKLNNGKHTACVYSPQLNLVEVGSMVNEEQVNGAKVWKENTSDLSKMYLYLFNNYWHTNYKAYQEGYLLYSIDFWME